MFKTTFQICLLGLFVLSTLAMLMALSAGSVMSMY